MAKLFDEAGFMIVATKGTFDALQSAGIAAALVLKVSEGRPNVVDMLINNKISMVVNTHGQERRANTDGAEIRAACIKGRVPYCTTIAAAKASGIGILACRQSHGGQVKSLQNLMDLR